MIQPRATELFLFVLLALVVVWEIVAIRWGADGATISDVMHGLAKRYPEVPLFIGLVVGHWFWNGR